MKLLFLVLTLVILSACGSNESKKEENASTTDITKHPDYQKGLDLISKTNCFTCHKIEGQLTGPAYRDIANKYESSEKNVSDLAHKIINGSVGVWGQVPMPPRTDIPGEDAKAMARYILLLKK